jgi:hypothetical protein
MDLAEHLWPGFLSGMGQPSESREEPIVIWKFWAHTGQVPMPELNLIHSRGDGSHRQRAQRGFFTRLVSLNYDPMAHVDPIFRDLEAYLISKGHENRLTQIRISGRAILPALYDLYQMNVTPATIFPDLQGAAQNANMVYRMIGEGSFRRLKWSD